MRSWLVPETCDALAEAPGAAYRVLASAPAEFLSISFQLALSPQAKARHQNIALSSIHLLLADMTLYQQGNHAKGRLLTMCMDSIPCISKKLPLSASA